MATIGQQVAEQVARITNEVDSQAAKIAEISALLEGKAVSATSLETCTVNFSIDGAPASELPNMELIYLNVKEDGTMELVEKTNITNSFSFVTPYGSFIEFVTSKEAEYYVVNTATGGYSYSGFDYSKDGRNHRFIPPKAPIVDIGFY